MPNPFAYGEVDEVLERAARAYDARQKGEKGGEPEVKSPFGEDVPQWMVKSGLLEAGRKDWYGMFEESEAKTGRQHPRLREQVSKDLTEYWENVIETAPPVKREAWESDYNLLQEGRISTRELEGNPFYAKRALQAEHAEARRRGRSVALDGYETNAYQEFTKRVNAAKAQTEWEKGERQRRVQQTAEESGLGALDPQSPEARAQLRFVNEFASVWNRVAPQVSELSTADQLQAVRRRMEEEGVKPPMPLGKAYIHLLQDRTGLTNVSNKALGIEVAEPKEEPLPDVWSITGGARRNPDYTGVRKEEPAEPVSTKDQRKDYPVFGELA